MGRGEKGSSWRQQHNIEQTKMSRLEYTSNVPEGYRGDGVGYMRRGVRSVPSPPVDKPKSSSVQIVRTHISPPIIRSRSSPIQNKQRRASSDRWSPLTHSSPSSQTSPQLSPSGNFTSHRTAWEDESDEAEKSTPARPSNPLRYKTELCRTFEESGICRFGETCTFAHGFAELRAVPRHPRYKTEPCRTYHTLGYCQYGARCHFVHDPEEAAGVSPLRGHKIKGGLQDRLGAAMIALAANAGVTPSPDSNHVLLANLQRLCFLQSQQTGTSTDASEQISSGTDSLQQTPEPLIQRFDCHENMSDHVLNLSSLLDDSSQFPSLGEPTTLQNQSSSPPQHSNSSAVGSSVSEMCTEMDSLDLGEPSVDSGFEPSINRSFEGLELGVEIPPAVSSELWSSASSSVALSESPPNDMWGSAWSCVSSHSGAFSPEEEPPAWLGMWGALQSAPLSPLTILAHHQKASVSLPVSPSKHMIMGSVPTIFHPMDVSRGLQLPSISDLCHPL